MELKELQSLIEELCKEHDMEKETLLKIIVLYEEAQDLYSTFYINPLKELDVIEWGFDRESQKRRIEYIIEKWIRFRHVFEANNDDSPMLL